MGQGSHVAMLLAPMAVENEPVGQLVHVDEAGPENLPAGQNWHTELLVAPSMLENVPPMQGEQVLGEVAPVAFEKVPAKHFTHTAVPVELANVPCGQNEQLDDPGMESCPNGQFTQDVELLDPISVENLPAAQGVQAATPAIGE